MADWDLAEPEQRLWDAFPRGEWVDLRSGDLERTVRAEVVTALLLGAAGHEPGRRPAVRLRGAVVTGRLDLMGSTALWPLVCEHCRFENPLRFVEATTGTVRLVDCDVPSMNAARMNARGIVNLHRSRIGGGLRFDRATITGDIVLIGAEVGVDAEGVSLAAEGLMVNGNLECREGFRAAGSVLLRGARIDGTLDVRDAEIGGRQGRDQVAMSLSRAAANTGIVAIRLTAHGEVAMRNARVVGSVQLSGAKLSNQPQPYEQLASHYTRIGQPAEARRVLFAKERLQRRTNTRLPKVWSLLQDATVAYGYQPWRPLIWLGLLVALGAAVFAAAVARVLARR
ncbi:hypothetical protein ACGFNU_50350 [Spirillospora sp. NPDC048911]|uniref:hypothetical protein n=1 Tax=Spirillospora sp. NPDC048911 TaxID=3364527 RepID=UPI00371545A5